MLMHACVTHLGHPCVCRCSVPEGRGSLVISPRGRRERGNPHTTTGGSKVRSVMLHAILETSKPAGTLGMSTWHFFMIGSTMTTISGWRRWRLLGLLLVRTAHIHGGGSSSDSCSSAGREDAHRLNPPRFCNAFNTSDQCVRHFTPRGLCAWSAWGGCVTDSACTQRVSAPTGTSYIFFKFHKVGSSTVGGTLRLALIATTGNVFTSCLRVAKLRNKTATERARYMHCSLCAKHDNTLPLLPFFRQPAILRLRPETRLAALFASPAASAVTTDRGSHTVPRSPPDPPTDVVSHTLRMQYPPWYACTV